jgi:hypothetical protein
MKKLMAHLSSLSISLVLIATSNAVAVTSIPEESGFSGFVNLGVTGLQTETNMISETPFSTLGGATVNSLTNGPDSQSTSSPIVSYEVAYTWASTKTQIFLGSSLEDFLRFDLSTKLGVRQGLGDIGIVSLEVIGSPTPTKVWSDPYQIGVDRQDTDRESAGARLRWDKVLGTELELRVSSKKTDIDDEFSGVALGLSSADRALLNRDGSINKFDLAYRFKFENLIIIPRLSLIDDDLDGAAMAHDRIQVEVSVAGKVNKLRYVTNLTLSQSDFDEVNPIYGVKDESDQIGFSFTLFWDKAFGTKWVASAGIVAYEDRHEIDFYDTKATVITVAMLRRF